MSLWKRTIESSQEVSCSEDILTFRPGFLKPIRGGLRKKQNLIQSRPSRWETGLVGGEKGIRLQKEE